MTGKGGFFKAHKDTPRAANMFGSLVLVFPCPHEGGSLILRHKGSEWSFDSASEVIKAGSTSTVGFVAFFSDVEHEVAPVTSGHRLTLTYNLYLETKSYSEIQKTEVKLGNYARVKTNLQELLGDSSFLPEGGRAGFGLSHQYPFVKSIEAGEASGKNLETLTALLKGSDATLYRVCQELGLKAYLRFFFNDEGTHLLAPRFPSLYCLYDTSLTYELLGHSSYRAELIYCSEYDYKHYYGSKYELKPVKWIVPVQDTNRVEDAVGTYGNEPSVDTIYGDVCLIVEVSDLQQRGLAC
jgi:hypothetical protein